MASTPRSFAGHADLAATGQPWIRPATIFDSGVFFGTDAFSGEARYLDIQQLKTNGVISTTDTKLVAKKEGGKTTAGKCCATRFLGLKAGINPMDESSIRKARGRINDRKLERGRGEYAETAEYVGTQPIELATKSGINPFDRAMGTSEIDIVRMAVDIAEDVRRGPLTSFESTVIQAAVFKMLTIENNSPKDSQKLVSPVMLGTIARGITHQDIHDYVRSRDRLLLSQHEALLKEDPALDEELRSLIERPVHILDTPQLKLEIPRAAASVESIFNELLYGGRYGNTFGAERGVYSLLTDRLTVLDWTGLAPAAADLLEGLFYMLINVGLRNGDTTVTPDYMISDEEGSELTNPMHAKYRAELNRKSRGYRTVDISMYQYITDSKHIGDEGTQLRKYGQAIHQGTGLWFVGRQNDDKETRDILCGELKLSDWAYGVITMLPRGVFAAIAPDHPVEFIAHRVLPSEYSFVLSNRANTDATSGRTPNRDRPDVNARSALIAGEDGESPPAIVPSDIPSFMRYISNESDDRARSRRRS